MKTVNENSLKNRKTAFIFLFINTIIYISTFCLTYSFPAAQALRTSCVNLRNIISWILLYFIGATSFDGIAKKSLSDKMQRVFAYAFKVAIILVIFTVARVFSSKNVFVAWILRSAAGFAGLGNDRWILICGWIIVLSVFAAELVVSVNQKLSRIVASVVSVVLAIGASRFISGFSFLPILSFCAGILISGKLTLELSYKNTVLDHIACIGHHSMGILLCGTIFSVLFSVNDLKCSAGAYFVCSIMTALLSGYFCDCLGEILSTQFSQIFNFKGIDLDQYKKYEFLFSELVKRDFKKKYKRTVLGMFWSVLYPVMILLVMRMVFTQFFGRNTPHYTTYLFCGNLIFSYFSEATTQGMTALTVNASIFSKTNMPKSLFVLSKNIQTLINFAATIGVFFLFCIFDKITFTWKFITLLYPIVCLLIFNIGVGMILSALFVFFKDAQYLWSIFTRLLMYMSAIFYNIEGYPENIQYMFLLNPVYLFIRYFRKVVIDAVIPSPAFHILMLADALVVLGFGIWVYRKYDDEFMYYI